MTHSGLQANSIAEVYYHVMASPCAACGKGPLEAGEARSLFTSGEADSEPDSVRLDVTCSACRHVESREYALPHGTGLPDDGSPAVVNPGDSPSKLVDVAQWITLFRLLTTSAAQTTSKPESRRLGLEAAQCLDEALKFFDDPDSDLPPASAFFTAHTQHLLKEHPSLYSRQRLLELRSKLPTETVMRQRLTGKKKPVKKWWKPW